jgi:integrase
MTPKRVQDKRDPELWIVGDTYYYRGRPKRGDNVVERSLKVKVPERGNAIRAKKDLLIELRGLDPKQKQYLFRDVVTAVVADYERQVQAAEPQFKPKKQKTLDTFEWYAKKFLLPHFGVYSLHLITEEAWNEFIQSELNDGRIRDFARDARYTRQCLRRAQLMGKAVAIPPLRVPAYNRQMRRPLTQDEADAIRQSATGIVRPLIIGMWTNFFRPGEVAGLRWARIDFEKNTITLLPEDVKKPANARTVQISQDFRTILLEQKLKTGGGEFVFPGRGSQGRVYRWQKQWKRLIEKLGLDPKIDAYYTRHGALTEAARRIRKKIPDGNGNILTTNEVVKFAGTSIGTFEKFYLKFTHEDTQAVAALNAFGDDI